MNQEEFTTFKKTPELEEAERIVSVFREFGLEFELADNVPSLAPVFLGDTPTKFIEIKIRPGDFEWAKELLGDSDEVSLDEVPADYYLLEYSNEELYEVLQKEDEWNEFDLNLAKKLLQSRGKPVNEQMIRTFQSSRLEELREPEKVRKVWIVAGLLLALVGGFLGIAIGWALWQNRNRLPNGEKVWTYSEPDRKMGKIMFYLGVGSFLLILYLRIREFL
ncbi:MAG: hypothetical protein H6581_11135 [Bacteroidia bacterium]|nr:hypothetical protein [Bacteroidia bacterium]